VKIVRGIELTLFTSLMVAIAGWTKPERMVSWIGCCVFFFFDSKLGKLASRLGIGAKAPSGVL
jgi:hypothetical protein